MNTVHFRVSQISVPPLESEDISYSLSVHIGQTFIEYPLQIEEKNFLKSPVIVSFNYDSASDYEFHVELLEQKKYSDQIELASIDIPIRICRGNRQVKNGCLDMEIKDKSFLDNVAASTKENLDSDDEYDLEEDTKSIKIFFDIHRSENNKQRFTAPLTKMRDLNTAFLTTSRQSFDSSCSFVEQFNKKKSSSNKSALSLQENEDEDNQENEQKKKEQAKEELEEDQQLSDEKEQAINQDDLNDDEVNQDSSQIQQIEDQNEQESLGENSQVIEEEEEQENDKNEDDDTKEDDDIKEDDDKKEEKEESEIDSNDDKIDSKDKSGSQNKTEELMAEDSRPSRQHFLSESDSDDNEIGEDNENNNDHTAKEFHQINDFDDDDESIPPVELNSGSNLEDGNDEGEEKQLSIHRSLSSDSAQFKVYPPRNLLANAQTNKESELSEPETNEQAEKESQQLSENQDEIEPNEQQEKPELELSEEQEDPKLNKNPEEIVQQEDQIYIEQEEQNQQQKEQSPQIEIEMPPLSVSQQQQPLLYPQLNEIQIDAEPPVQQQAPILRFSSLDMQSFECLDNFSFYPSPEQIGSYYIPPSLLPISIHPPFSD